MIQKDTLDLHVGTQRQTDLLGHELAVLLHPGDLILLNGSLGAGKSALARATIRGLLGQPKFEVPSPTFLLVLPYEDDNHLVLHADLYRFENPNELDELGLFDDPDAIKFVEWSERAPQIIAHADLIIDISFYEDREGRLFQFSSASNSKSFQALKKSSLFSTPSALS